MSKLGKDIIGTSGLPSFFRVSNADQISIFPPENRKGDGLRTWVRSLSGFQKEALISSAKTGQTWRLVSDEGPYLNGHDAAPCPLAFLSVGMVASFMNEILALAEKQDVNIRKLKLIQNNCANFCKVINKLFTDDPIELLRVASINFFKSDCIQFKFGFCDMHRFF